MSIATQLTADMRSRANYLPYCPLCSFCGIPDRPDILHAPSHRTVALPACSRHEARVVHKLDQCCSLSADCPPCDSQAEVAQWWRARRMETLMDLANDNRRRSTIERLAAKNLEPL